jgi:hypothetical protein
MRIRMTLPRKVPRNLRVVGECLSEVAALDSVIKQLSIRLFFRRRRAMVIISLQLQKFPQFLNNM